MLGDDKSLPITSTRAITINTSKDVVWQLLMQLGAKKQGFYSYDILEENLKNKNIDLKIGDIIHGSAKEDGRLSSYNFKVLDIDPKDAIVLNNTFYKILISSILGSMWLVIVFLLNPIPTYIMIFLLICFFLFIIVNRVKSKI